MCVCVCGWVLVGGLGWVGVCVCVKLGPTNNRTTQSKGKGSAVLVMRIYMSEGSA